VKYTTATQTRISVADTNYMPTALHFQGHNKVSKVTIPAENLNIQFEIRIRTYIV